MGAVGWLLGVDSYDVAKEQRDRDVEKGEKEAMLLREGRGSEGMPGQMIRLLKCIVKQISNLMRAALMMAVWLASACVY